MTPENNSREADAISAPLLGPTGSRTITHDRGDHLIHHSDEYPCIICQTHRGDYS